MGIPHYGWRSLAIIAIAGTLAFACLVLSIIPPFAIQAKSQEVDDGCISQEEAVIQAMHQGAEVFLIEERMEVARGVGHINSGGGWANGATGFLIAVYSQVDLGEVYPITNGRACGYNRSTREDAMKFFKIVKTPDGRPA
jgi:hypothetical protein